jgi:hypothetical protein
MAMHTGEIANLTNIDLKNLGAPPTKRDRILREFLRKPIHPWKINSKVFLRASTMLMLSFSRRIYS